MRSRAGSIVLLAITLACAVSAQPSASFPAPAEEPSQSAQGTPVAPEPQPPPPAPAAPPGAQPYVPRPYRYPVLRDQVASSPDVEASDSRWYGWQILIADGLSIAAFASGVGSEGGELAVLGVVSYAVVPGAIHGAHGRAGAAFGSVGLRLGGPLIGAWLGSLGSEDSGEFGPSEGFMLGFMLGIVGAIAIDAGLLAHESVPKRDGARLGISVVPTEGGVKAAVSASF